MINDINEVISDLLQDATRLEDYFQSRLDKNKNSKELNSLIFGDENNRPILIGAHTIALKEFLIEFRKILKEIYESKSKKTESIKTLAEDFNLVPFENLEEEMIETTKISEECERFQSLANRMLENLK